MTTKSQFTDNANRVWTLDINCDSVERVQNTIDVSLYLLLEDKLQPLAELVSNMPAIAHVCYLLADAEAQGVSRLEWARGIKGDPFEAMVEAFMEELALFFPDPRLRAAVQQFVEASKALRQKALDLLSQEMATFDPQKAADGALTKMRLKASGSSQEPRKSAQRKSAPSPSGN